MHRNAGRFWGKQSLDVSLLKENWNGLADFCKILHVNFHEDVTGIIILIKIMIHNKSNEGTSEMKILEHNWQYTYTVSFLKYRIPAEDG